MRKAFDFIPYEDVVTPVRDSVSATIPDQSLSLRELLMQFAYIGTERLQEIVDRGFYGDEDDDDILGVDVGALDFAEVHDRLGELLEMQSTAKSVHAPASPEVEEEKEVVTPESSDTEKSE